MYIIVSTEDNIMHVSLSILANRDGSTSTEKHYLNASYGSITLISEDVFDISGTIKIPSASVSWRMTRVIHAVLKMRVGLSVSATRSWNQTALCGCCKEQWSWAIGKRPSRMVRWVLWRWTKVNPRCSVEMETWYCQNRAISVSSGWVLMWTGVQTRRQSA